MKPFNNFILLTLMLLISLVGNANDCKQGEDCSFSSCPEELRKLVGVWHGHEEMDLNSDLLSTEVQMIFADKACRPKEGFIVGRQTTVIPSGKNNASRTDYKEVTVSNNKGEQGSAGDDSKLSYSVSDLQIKEGKKKTTLGFTGRKIEFQKLVAGQVTYFAGKTWALTADGKLIGVNNFVMESSYVPSSNEVEQKIHYQGAKGAEQIEVSRTVNAEPVY